MIRKIVYRIPGLVALYHLCFSFFGAVLYGFPSRNIFVIGVTGTKGKTTVLELMNSILEASGKKTALLSSITVKIGDERKKNTSDMTMPGRFFIQRFLGDAVRKRCTYALVEVTSQGVLQHRHRFIDWNAAFLINLHPEHIEAHGSFENYRAAKLLFLRYAAKKGAKIFINKGDKNADFYLASLRGANPTTYEKDDVAPSYLTETLTPMAAIDGAPHEHGIFPSEFNRENIAAARALARMIGIAEDTVRQAIRRFRGVPGRMEFVKGAPCAVVIDYAHTPDSLEAVYKSLKSSSSKLVCVLGSAGGGRDKWKRPVLGTIAAAHCDRIILTDEDPYDENPEAILREIQKGIEEHPRFREKLSGEVYKILDRKEAIAEAIKTARTGDTVIITGKGSEEWIHAARGRKIPWSDVKIAEEILAIDRKK